MLLISIPPSNTIRFVVDPATKTSIVAVTPEPLELANAGDLTTVVDLTSPVTSSGNSGVASLPIFTYPPLGLTYML